MSERRPLRLAGAAAAALVLVLALAGAPLAGADTSPDPSDITGTLIAGGAISGTADIDFLVNPDGTYTATITVDGSELVSGSVTKASAHLYLDTTQLADGAHNVVVAVGDGTVSDTVWSGTIETLNAPRGGLPTIAGSNEIGATLTATPGSWSPAPGAIAYQWESCSDGVCTPLDGATGQSYILTAADADSQLEVEVTASNADGSTVAVSSPTATVLEPGQSAAVGTANGGAACAGAQLTAAIGAGATERVSLGQPATVHGELDCDGTPIVGATLDLALAPASGTTPMTHEEVQTAADGSFSYTLTSGPSRDITVAYSAVTGAPAPTAVATLALLVTPRVTLRITPRSTTNGHTIAFAGRVLGGFIGRGGLPLDIEYREGSRWMIYTEVLADPATGRFRWHYTFRRTTESITYTFRVAIPATGVAGYPYQPAASPPRSVHVDP